MNRMDGSGDIGMGASVSVSGSVFVSVSVCMYVCVCVLKSFNRRCSYHLNYHMHIHTKARIPSNDVCKCIVREYERVYPKYMHTLYAKSSMKMCLSNISIDFF